MPRRNRNAGARAGTRYRRTEMPGFTYDLHGPADESTATPAPWAKTDWPVSRPALRDFTPSPITEEDERNNPNWPAIVDDAPMALACSDIREQYNRTRCQNFGCSRCWGGQHA